MLLLALQDQVVKDLDGQVRPSVQVLFLLPGSLLLETVILLLYLWPFLQLLFDLISRLLVVWVLVGSAAATCDNVAV